jgi:hypothetical protein
MYYSLKEFKYYKLTAVLCVIMKKGEGENYDETSVYLRIDDPFLIQTKNTIDDFSMYYLATIFEEKMEAFNTNGSGWTLKDVEYLDLTFVKYRSQKGGYYIPTPYDNNFVLNIDTGNNNDCFQVCILAHFYKKEVGNNYNRASKYRNLYNQAYKKYKLDFSTCEEPMPIDKIRFFENRNPIVSVCVYQKNRKNDIPKPLYISKFLSQREHHVNLLLLTAKTHLGDPYSHYCLIGNYMLSAIIHVLNQVIIVIYFVHSVKIEQNQKKLLKNTYVCVSNINQQMLLYLKKEKTLWNSNI